MEVSITPLSCTRSGVEDITTSINDSLDSVILVGEVINCLRFNSEAKFSNDRPSGFCCKRLQFKSLRIITGLLRDKA
jgi:hypothetical protein